MQTIQYAGKIVNELQGTIELIADEEAEKLVHTILQSKKIFLAGAGRSGLMGRAFAMRVSHMGFEAYVVGETVTPGLEKGDLLIIGSGSGATKSLVPVAEKAKSLDGTVVLVTIFPESTIGKIADFAITLPGSPKDRKDNEYKTIQPMGSLFEQTLLIFYDAVILRLMERQGMDNDTMFGRHANLEFSKELWPKA